MACGRARMGCTRVGVCVWACLCTCDSTVTARRGARENYKYKQAASAVGNLQPGWSRFHSSKCHLSNVLAYYDLSFVRSR